MLVSALIVGVAVMGEMRALKSVGIRTLLYTVVVSSIAVAISLVGAIVGELPTGAVAGLGARLLAGSYYGQTVQIWAALVAAALMAAVLVALIGVAAQLVNRRMGVKPERAAT